MQFAVQVELALHQHQLCRREVHRAARVFDRACDGTQMRVATIQARDRQRAVGARVADAEVIECLRQRQQYAARRINEDEDGEWRQTLGSDFEDAFLVADYLCGERARYCERESEGDGDADTTPRPRQRAIAW